MSIETVYAAQQLAQVIRRHGIYELREVLTVALQLASRAKSAEQLADALEAAANQ